MKYRNLFLISLIVYLCLSFILIVGRIYVSDVYYKTSRGTESKDVMEALKYIDKSISLNPNEPAYYIQRAKLNIAVADSLSVQTGNTFRLLALEDLQKAYDLNPKNLVTIRNSFGHYYNLAKGFDGFKQEALGFYTNAEEKYQNDLGVLVWVYKYEKDLDFVKEAENVKAKIEKLRPDIIEWHANFK